MSGQHGIDNIKSVMTIGKLGVISMIQKLPTDGVTIKALTAPLQSEIFLTTLEKQGDSLLKFLPELSELDMVEKMKIGKHGFDCWCDIKLEWSEAMKKIRMKKNQTR